MVGCRCEQKLYRSSDFSIIFYYKRIICGACAFLGFLIRSISETLATLWASFKKEKKSRVSDGLEPRNSVGGHQFVWQTPRCRKFVCKFTRRRNAVPRHVSEWQKSIYAFGRTNDVFQQDSGQRWKVRCRFHESGPSSALMWVDYRGREGVIRESISLIKHIKPSGAGAISR